MEQRSRRNYFGKKSKEKSRPSGSSLKPKQYSKSHMTSHSHPYVGIIQIRFSVEGSAFLSACNTSSRLYLIYETHYTRQADELQI